MVQRIRKTRVVLTGLGRLSFHAKLVDVAAELAKCGIEVSGGLVQKVKIELMKNTSRIRRQKAKATMAEPHPKPRVVRRMPARRSQGR